MFISGKGKSEQTEFTISAEVTKSRTINLSRDIIIAFVDDLSIYPKYFPNIISVRTAGDNKSEWVYEIDPPMASAYQVTFVLKKKVLDEEQFLYESTSDSKDYLYSRVKFSSLSEKKTRISLQFKIRMTRESAADVHFMAPILGEKFISSQMQKDLSKDLDTFIKRVTDELYRKYGNN